VKAAMVGGDGFDDRDDSGSVSDSCSAIRLASLYLLPLVWFWIGCADATLRNASARPDRALFEKWGRVYQERARGPTPS
jgi:hypothetical protein